MKKTGIVISLHLWIVLILVGSGLAQNKPSDTKKQFPLELSFFNHAVTMPFDGIVMSPLHPGISIGTEYGYTEGRLGRIFQNLHVGYYHNKYNAKALFLKTEGGYRYTTGIGLFGEFSLGLGYLHSFHPREIFAMNAQGEYEQVKDKGKAAVIFLGALGIGYDFSCRVGWPVSLFIRFQPFIQTPYSIESSLLPQSMVHFGVRVQLW